MSLVDRIAITLTKFISLIIKLLHLGAGATWPGEIVLRLRPGILKRFSQQLATSQKDKGIILVAGTNGKTTTVKLIETILSAAGKKVARNSSGANLDNGLVSTFLAHSNLNGKLSADYFIFEVDEATLPIILKQITPHSIVLLNLFRDQLDRYGEVDAIAEKWLKIFRTGSRAQPIFIINGDDPQLAFIGEQIASHRETKIGTDIVYFGLDNPDLFLPKMQHATDSIYCPKCGNRLTFGGVYFSHLGKYACGQCGFTHPALSLTSKEIESPLEGVYNEYNILAATLVCQALNIPRIEITAAIRSFQPAFGRMEELTYKGKKVKILLSKNPTGFNESLRTALKSKQKGNLLFLLNDRIPDGTDVSWIWDVDFELLTQDEHTMKENDKHMILVSGDRCYDMGLRLKYAGLDMKNVQIEERIENAVEEGISSTTEQEMLWILATYSAMLDVRKVLVGRKIL